MMVALIFEMIPQRFLHILALLYCDVSLHLKTIIYSVLLLEFVFGMTICEMLIEWITDWKSCCMSFIADLLNVYLLFVYIFDDIVDINVTIISVSIVYGIYGINRAIMHLTLCNEFISALNNLNNTNTTSKCAYYLTLMSHFIF